MKAIHNEADAMDKAAQVVLYPKDTEKWKQFTTEFLKQGVDGGLCCIPKILKNESNSQPIMLFNKSEMSCVVSQRYWKMKAIHNAAAACAASSAVVLYPKDTEKWKQFTTDEWI